jgi:hypothetical protein
MRHQLTEPGVRQESPAHHLAAQLLRFALVVGVKVGVEESHDPASDQDRGDDRGEYSSEDQVAFRHR